MTNHAVVIAGGGPTGLMLAGELALAGGADGSADDVVRDAYETLVRDQRPAAYAVVAADRSS